MKGRDGGCECGSVVGRAEDGCGERWSSSSEAAGARSRDEVSSRPHAATEARVRERVDEEEDEYRTGRRDGWIDRIRGRSTALCDRQARRAKLTAARFKITISRTVVCNRRSLQWTDKRKRSTQLTTELVAGQHSRATTRRAARTRMCRVRRWWKKVISIWFNP